MRLLVIEDNEKLASLMKKLLSDVNFVVDTFATAEEGKAALKVADYDLLVLDLSLPDQDGTDVLQSLRRARAMTSRSWSRPRVPTSCGA